MINQALANKLLMPLWALFPKADDDPGYQDIIARMLSKACEDEAHAVATAQRLVETCRYKPLPVEVTEAADAVRPPAERWPEPWQRERGPADEPFNGLGDLIDGRVLQLLRDKAEHGGTHAERVCARQFLQLRQERQKTRGAAA